MGRVVMNAKYLNKITDADCLEHLALFIWRKLNKQ
jgi:hypothetical protein